MAATGQTKKIFDDRYEILSIVGRGSRSVVYHARHVSGKRNEVALKVLLNKKDQDQNSERLRKEALAMVSARHKYVIRLDDFHSVGNLCYLSMEYAPEADLRQYLNKLGGKLSPRLAELYLLQTGDALHFIHQAGLLHRDIKPDNILVVDKDNVRIGDFGVAILPGEESSLEELQSGVGTMSYMAPEVLDGKGYGKAADIYALAVTFYELLTGKHPFEGAPLIQQLEVRKDGNFAPIQFLNPDVPDYLAKPIARAMLYNPEERYQTARDFIRDIVEGQKKEAGESPEEQRVSKRRDSDAAEGKRPIIEPRKPLRRAEKDASAKDSSTSRKKKPKVKAKKQRNDRQGAETSKDKKQPQDSHELKKDSQKGESPESRKKKQSEEAQTKPKRKARSKKRPTAARGISEDSGANTAKKIDEVSQEAAAPSKAAQEVENVAKQSTSKEPNLRPEQPATRERRIPSRTKHQEPQEDVAVSSPAPSAAAGRTRPSRSAERRSSASPDTNKRILMSVAIALFLLLFLPSLGQVVNNFLISTFNIDLGASFRKAPAIESPIPNFKANPAAMQFPLLPPGMYEGIVKDIIPGQKTALALIMLEEPRQLIVILGIAGWSPAIISLDDIDASGEISVPANSMVLKLSGQAQNGELAGYITNMITGQEGQWRARPVIYE